MCVDSGTVLVGYRGKRIIFLNVIDHPQAQRFASFTSMFFNGAVAWNFTTETLVSFDQPEPDSTKMPSHTTEIRRTDYYYKGKKIRTDLEQETHSVSSQKSRLSIGKDYYFDETGEPPDMTTINQWIAFSASGKSYDEFFTIGPKYSAADTLRIDSITDEISKQTIPGLYSSTISKTFECEYSEATGSVTVLSGEKCTKIIFTDCGSDHGGSGFEAVFYNDSLIYYSEESGSWSFDTEHSTDTIPYALDETVTVSKYIEHGFVIKEDRSHRILSSYTGETNSIDSVKYYFDQSGRNVAELENRVRQWIDFAHSEKPYSEFFERDNR